MALFKVSKGASGALNNQALGDGYCWFTYDDGKFYIDYKDPSDNVVKRKALNANMADNDILGNAITETYVADIDIANGEIDLLAADGSTIRTVTIPTCLQEKTFTGLICAATTATHDNSSFYFGKIIPDSYYCNWKLTYEISAVTSGTNNARSFHNVALYGAQSNLLSYSAFNAIVSTSYKSIYFHSLYRATEAGVTGNYGHILGVGLRSSWKPTDANYPRTVTVRILECVNCSFTFFDNALLYPDVPGTGSYYSAVSELDAYSQGLRETGDDNTTTVVNMAANRLNVGNFKLGAYSVFAFDRTGNAWGISASTESSTVAISTSRTYNTSGADWHKGLFYLNNSSSLPANTDGTVSVYSSAAGLDFRYTDNCMNSTSTTVEYVLGMRPKLPIYLRGVIKEDGLFYLAPMSVTYNNNTYQKCWTQDIPTSVETDGTYQYVYWFAGWPYANSTYPLNYYQLNLYSVNPVYWYHNGKFEEYTVGGGVADSVAWTNITGKPNDFTPSSHTHGNISNDGKITDTQTIANGDKIAIIDSSGNSVVTGSSISFDGSTTTQALTPKGTWESFGSVTSVQVQASAPLQSSSSSAQTSTLSTTISFTDQAKNTILAGPDGTTGHTANAAPTFRALHANDLPTAYGDSKNPYGNKTKRYVLAAPVAQDGAPSFRALNAIDIPDLSGKYIPWPGGTTQDFTLSTTGAEKSANMYLYLTKGDVHLAELYTTEEADKLIHRASVKVETGSGVSIANYSDYGNAQTSGSIRIDDRGVTISGNSNERAEVAIYNVIDPTTSDMAANKNYVDSMVGNAFAANDAMVFKGVIGANQTITSLPTNGYSAGWTYRVADAGTFAGEYCEVGDLIIAINDGPSTGNSVIDADWAKVEHNIDGALYKTNSTTFTDGHVLIASGTAGQVADSGFTLGTSVPANAVFTDTDTKVSVITRGTTKAYLLGDSNTPSSTAGAHTALADPSIYMDTTAGQLAAKTFRVLGSTGTSNTITSSANTNIYFTVNGVSSLCITDTAIRSTGATAGTIDLGTSSTKWNNVYANYFNGDGSAVTNLSASNIASGTLAFGRLPSIYWANLAATSAAAYNTAPEVATVKINGNTSASAASSKNVVLSYDSTTEVLNFVFN